MASERADEIKAGIMVLVGFAIFALALLLILGPRFGAETDRYTVLFKNTAGVEAGTDIRFGGMRVGQVSHVRISRDNPTMLELGLDVDAGTPIRTDSVVKITSVSMLGENHVEITTGTPEAGMVSPGAVLPSEPYASLAEAFGDVQGVVGRVDSMFAIINEQILTEDLEGLRGRIRTTFDQIETLLGNVTDVVNEENRENIASALAAVRGVLEESRPDIRTTIVNLRDASASITALADRVDGMASEAEPQLRTMVADLRDTAAKANALASHLDTLVVENTGDVNEMVDNLNATTANARDLTELLAQEPWRLVWRSRTPERVAVRGSESPEAAQ